MIQTLNDALVVAIALYILTVFAIGAFLLNDERSNRRPRWPGI